jgi:hypothetical protein
MTVPALRLNHALLAVAGLLALLAVWPLLPVREPPPLRPAPPPAPSTLASLPPAAQFAAVAARPLFSPSRRPPAGPAPTVTGGSIEQHYRLIGVVTVGHERRALLLEGTRRFEVGVGGRLDGFTVSRIDHGRVVLASPAGQVVLPLRQTAK